MSVHQAGKKYGIAYSTLRLRFEQNLADTVPLGHKPLFNGNIEQEIAETLLKMSRIFHGITPVQL